MTMMEKILVRVSVIFNNKSEPIDVPYRVGQWLLCRGASVPMCKQ